MWSHSEVLTFLYPLIQWLSSASVVVFFHQDRLPNAMQWCHVLISAPHSNPSPFSPSLWYLFPLELLSIWNLISVFNSLQCCSPWWPGCDFPNVVWWFYSLLLFYCFLQFQKLHDVLSTGHFQEGKRTTCAVQLIKKPASSAIDIPILVYRDSSLVHFGFKVA